MFAGVGKCCEKSSLAASTGCSARVLGWLERPFWSPKCARHQRCHLVNVLFHLTVPDSPMAACDAVVQEVTALRRHLSGGQVNYLYPGRKPGTRFPRRWWGLHQLPALRQMEKQVELHHIFNPDPFPFAVLRFLRKPVVYTAVAGLGSATAQSARQLAQQVHTLVVPTEKAATQCRAWGIENVDIAGPIIDLAHFQYQAPPVHAPFTIFMGSAPWTSEQFQSKGVDALLQVAAEQPDVALIFLWRGVLFEEMQARVKQAGVADRVRVINKQVDVNTLLAEAHAAVLLVTDPAVIKAHPHSLLEALAAGKPILVNRLLPLAAMVEQSECGLVVEQVDVKTIRAAINELRERYDVYQRKAKTAVSTHFQSPLTQYQALYRTVATK
jgi:glycosyltransferase involved in cell wall biosynthesis